MTCPTCLRAPPPTPPVAPPEGSCPTCGGTKPPRANWDAVRREGGDDAQAFAEEYYDLEDVRPGGWSEAALRSLGVRWALRTAGLGGPDADHAWQWDQIGDHWAEVYDEGAHAVIAAVRERRADPRI